MTENLWLAKTAYRWSWTTWTEDLVYIIYAFDVGNNNIQCFLTKRWMIINNLFCEFKWSSWHHISVITSTGCFVVFLWFWNLFQHSIDTLNLWCWKMITVNVEEPPQVKHDFKKLNLIKLCHRLCWFIRSYNAYFQLYHNWIKCSSNCPVTLLTTDVNM